MVFKRFRESEAGQAMVEFALCLPLVMMMLGAVLDYGWLFMHELSLSTAVREGARTAVTSVSDGSYISKASTKVEETASICNNGTLHVSVTPTNPGHPTDGDIRVEASYEVKMLSPMAKLTMGGMSYEIHGSCTMRAE